MIIFDQGGSKNLVLLILVVLFMGVIVWQWIASDPFTSIEKNNYFIDDLQDNAGDSFAGVKNSIDESKESVSNISDELNKELRQAQLIEEAKKYLENKDNQELQTPDNKEDCELQEGEWQVWGKSIEESCNLFTSDADKECGDSSECEAYCIVDLPEITLKDLPVEVSGNCTARTTWQGCYSLVEKGLVHGVTCD